MLGFSNLQEMSTFGAEDLLEPDPYSIQLASFAQRVLSVHFP